MMLRPRLHDLYIGRTVLLTVLATWAVLLGLDVVLALSGEFEELGKGSYSIGHAIAWVAYTVPRRAYTLFPMAAVIGSLMGLGQLAATSDLTALMVVSGETVGPWGQARADLLRNSARANTDLAMARYSGLWAREGDTFLNAQSGEERLSATGGSELVLNQVRLYRLGSDGQLAEVTYAETARHDGQGWSLHQVRRDLLGERSARREVIDQQAWDSQLDPTALAAGLARPRNLSAAELRSSIEYRKRNGLDARDYEDNYWSRWFYPINVLALCLAAVPFAFGSLRSGGMGKRLFLGILFALGFWLLQMFFGRMAGALRFDYRIAYALPPIVMLAISGFIFRRKVG